MASFEMNGVDLKRLQLAHQILADVVDRLVEIDEIEIEVDFEPVAEPIETPPHSDQGVQTFVLDSVLSSIG
jgi:hypothetical protein